MRTRAFTMADELVRAALADRLGEIRVPMRPQPGVIRLGGNPHWVWPPCASVRTTDRKTWTIGCPLGEVGDLLWGREAWANYPEDGGWIVSYRATAADPDAHRWRSALQMPREYSRLTYEITALRCERLQHITGYGARLSGFASVAEFFAWWDRTTTGRRPRAPRDGESVRENPWVFVASVRRVEVR